MGFIITSLNSSITGLKSDIVNAGNSFAVDTDNQFSWVPPVWPSWDADRSAFATSLLSAGILTPPEPGNPPYTDYATGLWNTVRTGIGGEDFPEPPPPRIVSIDFKDFSTNTPTSWLWEIYNFTTFLYETLAVTQDIDGYVFSSENTDYYSDYSETEYEIRVRLTATNIAGSDQIEQSVFILKEPLPS
jgi:hypothetical protein